MTGAPPRLAPTLALLLAWAAIYVLWLAVKPQESASTTTRPGVVATSTTVTTAKALVPLPGKR